MKKVLSFLLFNTCFLYCFGQNNPYAIFGYKTNVEYKNSKEDTYRVKNADPTSKIKFLEFDFEKHLVKLFDQRDSVIQSIVIMDDKLLRFLSPDPISKKYPELTPYQFASNSPISRGSRWARILLYPFRSLSRKERPKQLCEGG